jgi:hypothetical protein
VWRPPRRWWCECVVGLAKGRRGGDGEVRAGGRGRGSGCVRVRVSWWAIDGVVQWRRLKDDGMVHCNFNANISTPRLGWLHSVSFGY